MYLIARGRLISQMLICSGQKHSAAGRSGYESQLDKVGLVNVFYGGRILASIGGNGIEPDGAPAELGYHRFEHASIDLIEAKFIYAEHFKPAHCRFAVYHAAAPDLRKIAHTLQKTVGDSRRAAGSGSDLKGAVLGYFDPEYARAPDYDLLEVFGGVKLELLLDAEPVAQGGGKEPQPLAEGPLPITMS